MKKIFVFLAIFAALSGASTAQAAQINSGETISIEKSQKNPLIFSSRANIRTKIDGDLTAFAEEIKVEAPVEDSAYLFGQNIDVNSEIGNRLLLAGLNSKIKSEVKGDLILASGNATIDSSSKINGDVLVAGSNLIIKGRIDGTLRAAGAKITLDGAVINGDVFIYSDQISFSDTAQVNGKLVYSATKEQVLPEGNIKGGITFNQSPIRQSRTSSFMSVIASIVMLMGFAILLMWLLGKRLDDLTTDSTHKFGSVLLKGFLVFLIGPVFMMAMIVTYVGIYVFIAALLLYLLALLIGYAYGAILLGNLVVRWLSKKKLDKVDWSVVVFGSLILIIIGSIPVLGPVLKLVFTLAGVGMFINQILQLKTPSK